MTFKKTSLEGLFIESSTILHWTSKIVQKVSNVISNLFISSIRKLVHEKHQWDELASPVIFQRRSLVSQNRCMDVMAVKEVFKDRKIWRVIVKGSGFYLIRFRRSVSSKGITKQVVVVEDFRNLFKVSQSCKNLLKTLGNLG